MLVFSVENLEYLNVHLKKKKQVKKITKNGTTPFALPLILMEQYVPGVWNNTYVT